MISSPFQLTRHLSEPERQFDFVPFVDLCIIGLFFALHSSRFLFAPGVTIELPRADAGFLAGAPSTAVMTVRENNMILFEGQIFRGETLRSNLREFVKTKQVSGSILLIKADKGVDVQLLLHIFEEARRAGFSRVQVAAEASRPPSAFFVVPDET